ncbi:MAG: hypothetical protein CPSOU_1852 [uncultured Paraburkholderia sp.]|nr:MAG: hypothetical protein CPSOU_1852 [uncultured Paraburkholderia sp.]
MNYDHFRTLAELLREARAQAEMALVDLAAAAGTSKSYLSDIENGVCWRISVQVAARLADALHIPIDRLAKAAMESEADAARTKDSQ